MALNVCNLENHVSYCNQIGKSDYYIVKVRRSFLRETNISVCANDSIFKNQQSSENVCICPKDSVCTCVLSESGSFDGDSQELNEENSDESTSSVANENFKESLSTCVGEHHSTCRNMKESESLVDQLLNQLPKTHYRVESRKYWEMMLHCERAAFRRAAPNLPLPSREARFYWYLYSTAAKHSPFYQKEVNRALRLTLTKLIHSEKDKRGISIWEQLIRLKTFDQLGRKNLINDLVRFLCIQSDLESICLEGLSLTPDEAVRLVLALYNSRKTMKYVYCWRAFEKMVNTDHLAGSKSFEDKRIKKYDWFRAIGSLKFLTTLSVNYAYIATPTGDLLIFLAKKLGSNWHWLQLLCLEEDIGRKCNGGRKFMNHVIPDAAWREAHSWAPALKIQYAIIGIPNYDVHKWFLTKSTQVHTFALSSSVDLKFQQPWYLNCTFKTLYSWYSNTLVYLCLQLWHNREDLDNQLRKLFINLPSLRVFEFIGEIRKLKTLCTMCLQIRSCSCKVHSVNMQLQEVVHDNVDKEKWIRSVKCLMVCFKRDFEKMGVKFNIDFYCW